jgi:hypothetical protein
MLKLIQFLVKFLAFAIIVYTPTFLLIKFGYLNSGDGEYIIPVTAFCLLFGFRLIFYKDYKLRPYWLFKPLTLLDKGKLFLAFSGYLLAFELLIIFIRKTNP